MSQFQTVGNITYDLYEYVHSSTWANVNSPDILTMETGHLRYEQGRGVVKTQEADCPYCEQEGLNDGRWHSKEQL